MRITVISNRSQTSANFLVDVHHQARSSARSELFIHLSKVKASLGMSRIDQVGLSWHRYQNASGSSAQRNDDFHLGDKSRPRTFINATFRNYFLYMPLEFFFAKRSILFEIKKEAVILHA